MFSRPNRRGEIANLALRALQAEDEMARLGITPAATVDGVRPVAPAVPDEASSTTPTAEPAVASPAPDAIDDELAKLRDQVTARPIPPPAPPPPPPLQPSKRRTLIVQAAAAMALTLALGAAWWSWSVSPPTAPDAAAAALPAALVAVELDPAWYCRGPPRG